MIGIFSMTVHVIAYFAPLVHLSILVKFKGSILSLLRVALTNFLNSSEAHAA